MSLSRRLFRLIGREPAPEEDIAAEFEAHLALKTDALVKAGLPPAEARREAERRFGTLDRSEEHTSELQSRLHPVCRLLLAKRTGSHQRLAWQSARLPQCVFLPAHTVS